MVFDVINEIVSKTGLQPYDHEIKERWEIRKV